MYILYHGAYSVTLLKIDANFTPLRTSSTIINSQSIDLMWPDEYDIEDQVALRPGVPFR